MQSQNRFFDIFFVLISMATSNGMFLKQRKRCPKAIFDDLFRFIPKFIQCFQMFGFLWARWKCASSASLLRMSAIAKNHLLNWESHEFRKILIDGMEIISTESIKRNRLSFAIMKWIMVVPKSIGKRMKIPSESISHHPSMALWLVFLRQSIWYRSGCITLIVSTSWGDKTQWIPR